MGNEKELSVLIKMRADIDSAIKKVNDSLDSVSKRSNRSSDSMTKGFKKALQPVNDLRLAFVRTGAAIAFLVGSTKIIDDIGEKISAMDSVSFKLGMTTEDLSRKMYGFNMATDRTRVGVAALHVIMNDFKNVGEKVKGVFANIWGNVSQSIATSGAMLGNFVGGGNMSFMDTWNFAGEDLKRQEQEVKENSAEVLQTRVKVENELRRMKLSTYEYQKVLLAQEVNDMKIAGVSETKLREYQANREHELLQQRFGFKKFSDFMDGQFSSTITSMKGTMTGFFNDAFTGQLKKGQEYFKSFGENILNTFSSVISEMITRWLLFGSVTGALGSGSGLLGWLGFHGGGEVSKARVNVAVGSSLGVSSDSEALAKKLHGGGIIRAHNGLAFDEVPAILQTGEGVLSRRGMNALGRDNFENLNRGRGNTGGDTHNHYYITAVDAASFESLCIRNPRAIHSVVQQAKRLNNPIYG